LSRAVVAALATLTLVCAAGFSSLAHAGYAAIVVDADTGKVLDSVNADQENIPASLTKMMTLYLAFQSLQAGKLKLDQMLPVSSVAANKAPTKLDLRAGQSIRVQDCILGMIVKSANDAATVVAERIGGSEAGFAAMMNAEASRLDMTGTRFGNANGLPNPENRTTARDMVKLAQALYRDYPQYASLFATRQFMFRGHMVLGHNRLMARYAGMDGLKTGYTEASGFNLASTAVRDGQRLFAVVLGGQTAASRDEQMAHLLDEGFGQAFASGTRIAHAQTKAGGTGKLLAALSPIASAEAAESVAPAKTHAQCVGKVRHGATGKTCKPHVATKTVRTHAKSASHPAPRTLAQKSKPKTKATTARKTTPGAASQRD
jgi:D-alanyl-D-alanine carboxypeptidase